MLEIKPVVSDFAMLEINYNILAEAHDVSVISFDLNNKIVFKSFSLPQEGFSSFFPVGVEGINGVTHIRLRDSGQSRGEEEVSIKYFCHTLDKDYKHIFVRHDLAIDVVNNLCFITNCDLIKPDKFNLVDDSVFMDVPELELNLFSGYDSNKSVHRAARWAHAIQCHLHNKSNK